MSNPAPRAREPLDLYRSNTPLRAKLKAMLAILALVLLALLLRQLILQFAQTQDSQRQYTVDYNAELSQHLRVTLEQDVHIGMALLTNAQPAQDDRQLQDLLSTLHLSLPYVQSLARLDDNGHILSDSDNPHALAIDLPEQVGHLRTRDFFYTNAPQGRVIELFLRLPGETQGGLWLMRLAPSLLQDVALKTLQGFQPTWLIENRLTQQALLRSNIHETALTLTPQEQADTLLVEPLDNSDWQLRAIFDQRQSTDQLLPALITKALLGTLLSLLPLIALLNFNRLRKIREGRRRYRDIFEGTGVALCVMDLSGLPGFLQRVHVADTQALSDWIEHAPERRRELSRQLRITEVNQVALCLLEVETCEGAWERLIDQCTASVRTLGYQVVEAILEQQPQLELEIELSSPHGQTQHLWLVMRLPHAQRDYSEVILSISDITSRKLIELSLQERERFWADVVRTVPDTLYVQDVRNQNMLFSNHHMGRVLGYDNTELQHMGERFWETLMHPEDALAYTQRGQQQRQTDYTGLMHYQLRLRHRSNGWRRFDVREQALARDAQHNVTRIIGLAKDITEQLEASESLHESEKRYRMLAESISDVIFSTDNRLTLNYVSPSVHSVLGYEVEWIIARGWYSILANPQQLAGVKDLMRHIGSALNKPQRLTQLRSQVQGQVFPLDCLRADGRNIPMELRLVLLWDEQGRFEGVLGVGRDVSQQRRAEKDLRMAATVFEHSTSAILITDPAGYIVQANEAFTRVSGYAVSQVLDQLPSMLTVDSQQESHLLYVIKQLQTDNTWEGEVWLKRRNGEHYPAWVGITAVLDDEGDLASYVCFFTDISERKASEQRIHRLAYYDALTHLPNRTLFQDRLYNALQQAERQKTWVVLMFLDLDRFKPINDSLGHAAGDRMLQSMASRLLACVAEDDTVARMGGDEFTLLLQARPSREMALTRAIHVAEQILSSLIEPFVLENREFFVTASIGVALSPQDGSELSQLMKNADTAMYHAKERGKNNFQFYQADMNATALERLELESDLRHALEQQEFVLYYQPQFSGDGKRLTGAEALLRWCHPRRGLVPPGQFIPVLEELGLVNEVGDWVLAEACRQLKSWHRAKIRVPKVSVNISARQFSDGQLGTRIASILRETGLPPACLELELTESILMRKVDQALHTLAGLKKLGLSIAVDDFGTGYSSLNYLKQFPIDVLKIDQSFVDGLPSGLQDAQIARAIIAMAHSLNLTVIAEGVETHEQLDFLREHGCDEVQGYLFGRPMQTRHFEAQLGTDALLMLD